MPLMRIDLIKGRTKEEIRTVLDLSYAVARETLGIPEGDRYQMVTQHEPYEMELQDTGLGFERTRNAIVFSLASRPRTTQQKQLFYERLVAELHEKTGLNANDVLVNFVINDDEDWSFAAGRAQFLTGEL